MTEESKDPENRLSSEESNEVQDFNETTSARPMPQKIQRRVEQFFGMHVASSSRHHPLVEKMDGAHVTAVLSNADKTDQREHTTKRICVCGGLLVIFALCWLFLAYGQTEHVDAMITGIAGLIGGYGIGKASTE